jgi:mannose-6-phosphate isomerase-like protein (cupin superfamily)
MPGYEFYVLWGDDGTPVIPSSGTPPQFAGTFPPPGGSRLIVMRFPAAEPNEELDLASFDWEAAMAELEELLPGLGAAVMEMVSDGSAMHTTDTVDFVVVLEGTVVVTLEDDHEVELRPGSLLVQAGLRHGWRAKGQDRPLVAFAMLGADRRP